MVPTTDNLDLITAEEAAELLRSTPGTLAKLRMVPGAGPEFLRIGRKVHYPRAAVLRWAAARLQRSTADRPRVAA